MPVVTKRLTWTLHPNRPRKTAGSSCIGKPDGSVTMSQKELSLVSHCIALGLSRYVAITTFSNIAAIAAFCRISPSILNRFTPNLQAQ